MSTRDAVNPSHYKDGWSDDAELISITENLTSNGGQAVQYVARSTRLDESKNKGGTIAELIEDLEKAQWFLAREVKRLKALNPPVATVTLPVETAFAGEKFLIGECTFPVYADGVNP